MGTEICPFCPETRTSSLHRPRLVPDDLLESPALPSGLRPYLRDFHSRLCSEITLAARWPSARDCSFSEVVLPGKARPFLERWRTLVPIGGLREAVLSRLEQARVLGAALGR